MWTSTCLLLKSCEGREPVITEFYNSKHTHDSDDNVQDYDSKLSFKVIIRGINPY